MSLSSKASNLRYNKIVEFYMHRGGYSLLRGARCDVTQIEDLATKAAIHAGTLANSTDAPDSPPVDPSMATSALIAACSGMQQMVAWEQQLSKLLRYVPFPATPALHVLSMAIGLPHAHNHPPNIGPTNPVPIALPSVGPVISIPILSGASQTKVGRFPAARCGDMGLGVWCGGYFPMYEIFFGSATVWCEGARMSRVGVDATNNCTFSAPKPSDPPLGPMVGTTVSSFALNVRVGGAPMPSLFGLAVAGLFKVLGKGGKALYRKMTAKKYVEKLLGKTIKLNPARFTYNYDVVADLEKIASTRAGRELMDDLVKSKRVVYLEPLLGLEAASVPVVGVEHANMNLVENLSNTPSDSIIYFSPDNWANQPNAMLGAPKGTPSDVVLFHELNHSNNAARGVLRQNETTAVHDWSSRWRNFEEYSTVAAENGYREERGVVLRPNYSDPP